MNMLRRVDGFSECFLRFAIVTPRRAVFLTVVDLPTGMVQDIGEHVPCLDRDCDDIGHGECDLFGEAFCHLFVRSAGRPDTLDDDVIFARLERMLESA